MKQQLCKLLMVLVCGTGLSLAQTNMGHPPTTPPTFPTQQQPGTQQKPDESGPAGQVGATSTAQAVRSKIQTALQQDPSLANANISVNLASDNKVELTGTVADKEQKKTAKQIAETNAAGYKVVEHLKVEHSAENKTSHPGSAPVSTPPTLPPKQ